MIGMKQDFVISLLLHVVVLAVIIILSTTTGKASRPDLNLGPTVKVSMFQEIPEGKPDMPSISVPSMASSESSYESEPFKLQSITKKEEIKIKETPPEKKPDKKPEKKPETKPKDNPKVEKPPDTQNQTEQFADAGQTAPSGSSTELSLGGSDGGNESAYSGPLGEYYLGYDFGFVKSRISRNWENPVSSNAVIACKIYFQIAKNGDVQGVTVSESSGNSVFDRYAELAVKSVKKLPSLPQSFPDDEVLEVTLIFAHRP